MNGAEQRRQRTVAETLDQRLEDVTEVFDAVDARLFDLATKAQETRRDVNGLIARVAEKDALMALSRLHELLRAEHDLLWTFHHNLVADLASRLPRPNTFWGRVRWLVCGR